MPFYLNVKEDALDRIPELRVGRSVVLLVT